MSVKELSTKEVFDEFIKSENLSVVHFYADWAAQCEQINSVLSEMAKLSEYKGVNFGKLEAEKLPEIAMKNKIEAVPCTLLYRRGNAIDRVEGANPGLLAERIKKCKDSSTTIDLPQPKDNLETRLKSLVSKAPCMLFMKGDPSTPKCGFSRSIVGILDSYNADYQTFDILTDNDVREGLKKFSNWPTYPQLYVKGELIGGLDIVKEMVENGELEIMLPKKPNLENKIQELIFSSPVVIVMKGTRDDPKCVYTKQLMEIFDETNVTYETHDILSDQHLREAMKNYSEWPTFPQVYVNGELVGGYETIRDLYQSGELIYVLSTQETRIQA